MANFNIVGSNVTIDASIDTLSIAAQQATREQAKKNAQGSIILYSVIYGLSIASSETGFNRTGKLRLAGPVVALNVTGSSNTATLPTTGQIWPSGFG